MGKALWCMYRWSPSKSGFQMKVKEKSPEVGGVHCMIHRYTLACKTLPNFLEKVLNSVVKIVSFIKKSATTSRHMGADSFAKKWTQTMKLFCIILLYDGFPKGMSLHTSSS